MDVRVHWSTRFFAYLDSLKTTQNKDTAYVVIGELIYKTPYSMDYLTVSIVPKTSFTDGLLDKLKVDGYQILGEINTQLVKFFDNDKINVKIVTYESPKLPNRSEEHTSTPVT